MKYIEELSYGSTFSYDDKLYLLTCDHKANGFRLCYSLTEGLPQWIEPTTIVELTPIYTLDSSNNIVPVKESKKDESINIS